jgi:hypothetical protein
MSVKKLCEIFRELGVISVEASDTVFVLMIGCK